MEAPSTSNLGSGPFANSPEEVQGRRRPMRPCPYRNQYFNGSSAAYAEFKRVYSIPPDVEVRLLPNTDPKDLPHRPGELIFLLMAITEGGVRFPLHQFVRRVLRTLNPTSSQLTVNSYRIITSIIELRRQYNLTFRLEEFFGVYLVGVNQDHNRYYLSCRTGYNTFLIDHLPDSEEWVGIYVSVTGNFLFGPEESIGLKGHFRMVVLEKVEVYKVWEVTEVAEDKWDMDCQSHHHHLENVLLDTHHSYRHQSNNDLFLDF